MGKRIRKGLVRMQIDVPEADWDAFAAICGELGVSETDGVRWAIARMLANRPSADDSLRPAPRKVGRPRKDA